MKAVASPASHSASGLSRSLALYVAGIVALIAALPCCLKAVERPHDASSLDQSLGDGFEFIGKIQPRHAKDIAASNWSIGAETMDRDYTVYAHWREHLGPLGAKKARIQSGWAKTEKARGVYDWDWVDEIVLDMVDQGVEPWVCLCYGNPIYPGGGDTGLGGGLVSSEEALQAWERYVAAFVERYKEHVDEWELWNEPRTGRGQGTVRYGEFVVRTAETIRKIQPDAEIMFAAGGSFDTTFAKEVLEYLRKQDKLALVNTIIYHPYKYNPDESYGAALGLRKLAKSFAPHIDIRQGENGAPSRPGSFGAVSRNDWTERAQAKWALRRLLGDLGRDIPSSYFAICDMRYPSRVNYKGLLAINEDKTVRHKKLGYYAMQHLTALFDDTVKRVEGFAVSVTSDAEDSKYSAFGYRGPKGGTLVTLWRSSDTPDKKPDFERVRLTVHSALIREPVWVDLLTGRVYAIDHTRWRIGLQGMTFAKLPVYDSVVVVADRQEIERVLIKDKPTAAEDAARGPVLESSVTIHNSVALSGVKLAVEDVANDLEKVLGAAAKVVEGEDADLTIRLDKAIGGAESYRIDIRENRVVIGGADELGVIYVCNVREHVLGIQVATEIMTDRVNWNVRRFGSDLLRRNCTSRIACCWPICFRSTVNASCRTVRCLLPPRKCWPPTLPGIENMGSRPDHRVRPPTAAHRRHRQFRFARRQLSRG